MSAVKTQPNLTPDLSPDLSRDPATKTQVMNRLKRLEGQVRGLQKMVEEGRDCHAILTLLAGVRSALEATGEIIFETYLEECQANLAEGKGDSKAIVEAVRLLRG